MTVARCLLCLCFVLSITVSAEAETKTQAGPSTQHVLGTVTAIDEQHVKVKTSRGVVVSVKLTKQVLFKDKSNPQSTSPPTVGDRVIIEATKENKVLTATVVYYSPVKNASATAP